MSSNGGDIVYDGNNELVLDWSPDIKTRKDLSESDYMLAKLLCSLKSFNTSIIEARESLSIIKTYDYPSNPTADNLIELYKQIPREMVHGLNQKAREIQEHYQLTENWKFSIELAMLTNTLLIPRKESIKLHLPDYFYPEDKSFIGSVMSVVKMRQGIEVTRYPAIYFTRQVSIDELKRWINDNKKVIKTIQYRLPKQRKIRVNEKTLFWGKMAWLLKQDGIHSWSKMAEIIDKMIDREAEGREVDKDDFTLDYPTSIELKKYHTRFIQYLNNLVAKASPTKSDD